jgi:hypothetical protein
MEYRIASPHQSALILAAWITLAPFVGFVGDKFPETRPATPRKGA